MESVDEWMEISIEAGIGPLKGKRIMKYQSTSSPSTLSLHSPILFCSEEKIMVYWSLWIQYQAVGHAYEMRVHAECTTQLYAFNIVPHIPVSYILNLTPLNTEYLASNKRLLHWCTNTAKQLEE